MFFVLFHARDTASAEARPMHLLKSMPSRYHLWLRLGALALLATLLVLPRASGKASGPPAGVTAAEVVRGASDIGHSASTHGRGRREETTAARLVSPPRTSKLVVADADDSHLKN